MARVLVTGGAGFIGSHVVDALVESGHQVRVLDLLHPLSHCGVPSYLNPLAEYIWGDLIDGETTARAVDGIDAVSHQASMVGLGVNFEDIADYARHNDLGTAILLRALARAGFRGRFVLASSMVVYGEGLYRCQAHGSVTPAAREPSRLERGRFETTCPRCRRDLEPQPLTEEAPTDPRNVYAATKLHQEHLAWSFGRECDALVSALRYHNVYGPRMARDTPYAGVAAIFRSALEAGRAPQVFEDGHQLRDFVHVGDVARANVLALTVEPAPTGPVNVATGHPRTVGDMATALSAGFGPDAPVPEVTGRYRNGDVRHVFASVDRARRVLAFDASTDFEAGMTEFASAELRDSLQPDLEVQGGLTVARVVNGPFGRLGGQRAAP